MATIAVDACHYFAIDLASFVASWVIAFGLAIGIGSIDAVAIEGVVGTAVAMAQCRKEVSEAESIASWVVPIGND